MVPYANQILENVMETAVAVYYIGAFCLGLYFIPTIVAYARRSRLALPVLMLNLFLGWTCLGWVAAIIMSVWPQSTKS